MEGILVIIEQLRNLKQERKKNSTQRVKYYYYVVVLLYLEKSGQEIRGAICGNCGLKKFYNFGY
jgi:hypothetical protein